MAQTLTQRLNEAGKRLFAVSGQDRALFFRCLGTMFNSGLPLVKSLDLLGEQVENKELSDCCRAMSVQVSSAVE